MKTLKPILKICISILILYLVYQNIDAPALWETLKTVNLFWVMLAFGLFILSQYISSLRLQYFWRDIGVRLNDNENWKLYLIGMYYNLLLPGGIGGDGYKVFLLDNQHQVGKSKLIKALVFDRLSGLLALGLWLCLLLSLYCWPLEILSHFTPILVLLGLIALVGSNILVNKVFTSHSASYWPSLGLSLFIQGLQLTTCCSILYAFSAFKHILAYLALFLVSSIAAVIPITFGGAGARELTFLTGAQYFPVDVSVAISLSVIFYLLTVIASLLGMFYSFKK